MISPNGHCAGVRLDKELTVLTGRNIVNTLKRVATPMLIAVLLASPAYAGIESCRDPTPDEQFQLDLCSAHAGCIIVASVISDCAKVTAAIKKFFSSQKPELDPGEYKGDQNAPPGPSEREQARKDRELYQRNRSLEESGAREAYHQLRALDRSIKERLEKYCGSPLDGFCRNAVHDAELLVSKVETYNNNAAFVRLRGKLTPESPGIAAPHGKIQEADREKFKREQDEHIKRMREMDAKIKRTQDADKQEQEGAKALATAPEPTNDEQKTLYALGLAISQSVAPFNLNESDLDLVMSGLTDGSSKRPHKVDLQTFGPKIQQLQQTRASVVAEAEKKAVAAAPPTPPAAQSSAETPASSSSLAQACEAEQQRFLTYSPGNAYQDLNVALRRDIPSQMFDYFNYVSYVPCDPLKVHGEYPICQAFRENKNGKHPFSENSQTYADALMGMADAYTNKAKVFRGRGHERWHAEMLLLACVARHEANRIKAAAVPPTQPDSGRMRADESGSVNGRIRAGAPIFTCCDAQTTNAHINDFRHDWDIREETLYQLGENMCEWGVDSKMQTIAGRAAFLQACDEKIAAARTRARSR